MMKTERSPNPRTVTITYPDQPNSRRMISDARLAGKAAIIILIDDSMVAKYDRPNDRITRTAGETIPSTRVNHVILNSANALLDSLFHANTKPRVKTARIKTTGQRNPPNK
jgi:hypothetical protein